MRVWHIRVLDKYQIGMDNNYLIYLKFHFTMDMDNSVGIDCRSGGSGLGRGGKKGKIGTTIIE